MNNAKNAINGKLRISPPKNETNNHILRAEIGSENCNLIKLELDLSFNIVPSALICMSSDPEVVFENDDSEK